MKLLLALGLVAALGSGCVVRRTVVVRDSDPGPDRVVADHVHSDHCGHVWNGGAWIVVRGHRHHVGCGHFFHSGGWHVHPAHHVYVHKGHRHFRIRIR